MATWTLCERLRLLDCHDPIIDEAIDRIEELERRLAELSGAQHKAGSSGTLEALRPPVEHHTRGSVLDYYRTIPKD